MNQFSVGIETMHTDTVPFAPTTSAFSVKPRRFLKEQYQAVIRICRELRNTYPVDAVDVIGHMEEKVVGAAEKGPGKPGVISDGTLSRDRVGCPGPYFEWERLEEAGVALKRRFFPATPPTFGPLVAIHQFLFDHLLTNTLVPAGTKSEVVRAFKRLLFDIGYSVSRLPVRRDELSDELDNVMVEALRAFQTHHFSGRRRRYLLFTPFGAERSFPKAGTLDAETMRAIVEVWWAMQHES